MNRHDRRRRARAARSRRLGYMDRIFVALDGLPKDAYVATVEHEPGCPMLRGGAECRCVPEIS